MANTLFTPATSSGSSTGALSKAVAGNGETADMFTTLLVAQIRNQNPLEPTDPSEFVNQLTQLSQMEALQSLASQGTASSAMLQGLQTLALGAQVGGEVSVTTDRVTLAGQAIDGSFTLSNASAKTSLVLTGADGVKHRIELGTRAPGTVAFSIDPVARGLPAGNYGLSVETDSGATPAVQVSGTLASVRLSPSGAVVIDVTGVGETSPESVTAFYGRTSPNPS